MTPRQQLETMTSLLRSLVAETLGLMYNLSEDVRLFHIPVEPRPASRPRWSRFGVYYSRNYTEFLTQARKFADDWNSQPKLTGPVAVLIEHVSTRPKTGKKLWPRGDVDNFAKGPMDVMTQSKKGSFWIDDDQVVWLTTVKRYAEPDETAHVTVYFCALELELPPTGIDIHASP